MNKKKILYVDDEENNLIVFKSAFRRDYQVFTAQSGEEGLHILQKEPIELVITDQRMPEMTGIQFLHKIIPLYPEIIRIILTGYTDLEAVIEAINQGGIYQYVRKPWKHDELKMIIEKGLETYRLRLENQNLILQLEEHARDLESKVMQRTYELDLKKQELERERDHIQSSIDYARQIQDALLPPVNVIKKAIPKSFVFFRPRDIVSGDFYWFSEAEAKPLYAETDDFELNQKTLASLKNEKTILAVVDCTGHGIPGAFMSMLGDAYLHQIINQQGITEAHEILKRLNHHIQEALQQPESGNVDGMDISLCVIDPETQTLKYAGAKLPLFYIENDELHELKGSIAPIGGEFSANLPREYFSYTLDISPSKTFYIFSDGFQDQFGGTKGRKFMKGHFKALLLEIHHKPMDEQAELLAKNLDAWMGDYAQVDDILVIGFRF
ncbi:MAG: response regulator [Microscillaceae bacterium]|nr:response regulator [Microscillaceae bacterium]